MGSYQRAVLNDNPIAYWRLNEPSGSSAIDCVGGNTGTITGAVLGQDGIVGGSMMLGSTAYVSFGTLSSLSTGVVSVEGWVNLRTKTGIRQCLVTSGESTNSGFVLAPVYESDTTRMGFWIRGNDNAWHNVNGSTGFFGDWIHVAATYDKTTLSVYINGQLCGTSTYSGTMLTPTSAGAIGASYDNTTNHLNGWASDVAIYDYVLTASQIKNHYLQGIYPANFYRGGRIYDYFRGVTLGGGEPRWWSNNLVLTNAGADPTFETSAGWSLANGASIANGVLTLTSNGSSAAIATAPLTGLLASTKYSFLIRARHTGTTPTAVLSLDLQGSGYDSGTQELDVSTGSLTTSFQTYYKSGFDSGSPPATAYIRIFTYSTAPIEIDLVQLTQENYASKSYGALLELYSSNLLSLNQSSVETDLTGISYWSPNGSATLTRDTTKAWVGSASAKITNNYTAAQTCTIDLGSACAGTAGLPYTVSAYLTASVAMTGYVHIRFFNSSGSAIAGTDVASPALSLKPGTWVRGSVSGTAPTGTAYVNIYTHYDTLAVGASGWADGLMIQQRSYATSWMPGGQGSNTETLWFPSRGILNPSQGSIELTAIFNSVSADSSLYQAVFGTGANNPGPRLMIMRNTNGKFAVWDGDGSTESSTDSTLTAVAGTKYYICYTWSSAGRFLYINGSQVATLSRTGNIGFDERSYIGSWNGGNQPNGAISDVRISNKARTLAEHQAHVNAGTPLAPDANTTYLLPLNGQFNSQIVAQEYGANMLSNAMATLTDTTNIGVGNSTIASTTDSGTMFDISNSLKVTASGSGQDSFACPGGDTGAMRLGMVAGGTYTMSAYEYVPSATGLSPNDSRGLKIVGYYCLGGTYYSVQGNRPTATGTLQRVSCTMTIPFGATEAFWRLYLGFSTSGLYTYYTALKLEQKPYPTAFSLGPDNIIPVSALSDLHGWNSTDSSNGWAVQQSNGMWRVGLVSSTSHDNGEILMSKYYPIAPGTTYTESFDFMSDGRPTISSITFYTTTHHAVPVTITEVGNGLFRATASYTAVAGETQLRALDFYVTRNDATYLDINFAQLTDGGGIQSFAVRTTSQIQRIQYGHIISTSSLSATINRTPSNSGDIVTTSLVGDWDGYITFPMTMPFYFNQTLVILQIPVSGSVSVTSTLSGGLSHLSAKSGSISSTSSASATIKGAFKLISSVNGTATISPTTIKGSFALSGSVTSTATVASTTIVGSFKLVSSVVSSTTVSANMTAIMRLVTNIVANTSSLGSLKGNFALVAWETTTNLWSGSLNTYNNYPSDIATTSTVLSETYLGQAVTRKTYQPTTSTGVSTIQNQLYSHGAYSSGRITYTSGCYYVASIYWRCSDSNVTVGGTASNIPGWSDITTVDCGDGWKRSTARWYYASDKIDYKYWSFRDTTCALNEVYTIDWVAPQIEKKYYVTPYVNGSRNTGVYSTATTNTPAVIGTFALTGTMLATSAGNATMTILRPITAGCSSTLSASASASVAMALTGHIENNLFSDWHGWWNNSGTATWNTNDTSIADVPDPTKPVFSMNKDTVGNSALEFAQVSPCATNTFYNLTVWCWINGTISAGSSPYIRQYPENNSAGSLKYAGSTNWATWPTNQWILLNGSFKSLSDATYFDLCTYLNNAGDKVAFNGWLCREEDTATMSLAVPIGGSVSSTSAGSATMTYKIPVAGSLNSVSDADATIANAMAITSSASASTSASATIKGAFKLVSSISATGTVNSPFINGAFGLTGNVLSTFTGTADALVNEAARGTCSTVSGGSATISNAMAMVSSVSASTSAGANISGSFNLVPLEAVIATSSVVVNVTGQYGLTGTASSTSTLSATIKGSFAIAGSSTSTGTVLDATIQGAFGASGTMLATTPDNGSDMSGNFIIGGSLCSTASSASATIKGSFALGVLTDLTSYTVSATITGAFAVAGSLSSSSSSAGSVLMADALVSSASATSSLLGSLNKLIYGSIESIGDVYIPQGIRLPLDFPFQFNNWDLVLVSMPIEGDISSTSYFGPVPVWKSISTGATATSSLTAIATVDIEVSSSISATSTGSGHITIVKPLSSSVSASTDADGIAKMSMAVASSASAASFASATIIGSFVLAGDIAYSTTASATIKGAFAIAPDSTITASSSLVATIKGNFALDGSFGADTSASATIANAMSLRGSFNSASTLIANIANAMALISEVDATSSVLGSMYQLLDGSITSESEIGIHKTLVFPILFPFKFDLPLVMVNMPISGSITASTGINTGVVNSIEGSVSGTTLVDTIAICDFEVIAGIFSVSTLGGLISRHSPLSSDVSSVSSTNATISNDMALVSSVSAQATVSDVTITGSYALNSSVIGASNCSVVVDGKFFISSSVLTSTDLSATVKGSFSLQAVSTTVANISATVSMGIRLVGSSTTATSLSVNSRLSIPEEGSASAVSNLYGSLLQLLYGDITSTSTIGIVRVQGFPLTFPFQFDTAMVTMDEPAESSITAQSTITAPLILEAHLKGMADANSSLSGKGVYLGNIASEISATTSVAGFISNHIALSGSVSTVSELILRTPAYGSVETDSTVNGVITGIFTMEGIIQTFSYTTCEATENIMNAEGLIESNSSVEGTIGGDFLVDSEIVSSSTIEGGLTGAYEANGYIETFVDVTGLIANDMKASAEATTETTVIAIATCEMPLSGEVISTTQLFTDAKGKFNASGSCVTDVTITGELFGTFGISGKITTLAFINSKISNHMALTANCTTDVIIGGIATNRIALRSRTVMLTQVEANATLKMANHMASITYSSLAGLLTGELKIGGVIESSSALTGQGIFQKPISSQIETDVIVQGTIGGDFGLTGDIASALTALGDVNGYHKAVGSCETISEVFADIANDMKVEATCLVSTAGEAFLSRHIPAKGQRIISLSSASITAYMDIQAQATYVKIVSDVEGSLIGRFPIASIITADSSTIAEITNKMAVSSAAGCHVTVQAIAECAMNLLGEVSSATTLGSESLMDCPIGADLDFVSTLTGWLVKLISGEIFTESTTTPILLGEWQLSGSIASATFLLAEAEVTYSPVTAVTVKFNTKEELTVELELENMVEVSHTEEDFAEALMKLEDAIDVGIETETSITADFITEITVTGKLEQIKSVDSLYYPLESQSLVQVISEVNLTSELTKEDRKEANIITSISTKGGN